MAAAQCAYHIVATVYSGAPNLVCVTIHWPHHTRAGAASPCHGPHAPASAGRLRFSKRHSGACRSFCEELLGMGVPVALIVKREALR